MVKIYAKGNFFFVIDANNVVFFDNIENSAVIKNESTSTSYSIWFKTKNQTVVDIAFSDIRDEAGSAYASQSAFETYVYENTGVRVSSGGGGVTNSGQFDLGMLGVYSI